MDAGERKVSFDNKTPEFSTHRDQPTSQPFSKGVSEPEGMPEGSSCDTYLYPMIRGEFERSPCRHMFRQELRGLGEAWSSAPACHPCPLFFLPLQQYQEGQAAAAAPLSAARSSSSCELCQDTTR